MFDKPSKVPLNFAEMQRNESVVDYYDLLGVPPDADPPIIQRVCRLLAMRYHPSNKDTGDAEAFRRIQSAYRVLSNPNLRKQYDSEYWARVKQVWRLGDALGVPTTQQRREKAILALLYRIRRLRPESPEASLNDLQQMLDCRPQLLKSTLDSLAEREFVGCSQGDHYFIKAQGVDLVDQWAERSPAADRLATAASSLANDWNSIWDAVQGWYSPEPLPPKAESRPDLGATVFACPRPGSGLVGASPGLNFIPSFPRR